MRDTDRQLLKDIATCLEYPGIAFEEKSRVARGHVDLDGTLAHLQMGQALSGLSRYMTEHGQAASEEQYTRLFDLSPVCTQHLGYHLYGDAYERGALLAALMPEIEQAGVRLDGELPDFLPVLLRLLAQFPDEEDGALLVEFLMAPGLAKMVAAVEKATDPWSTVVRALDALLRELVPTSAQETTEVMEAHADA